MTEKATAAKPALVPAPPKNIEREDFFEQFDRIYKAIEKRAFELFEGNGRTPGHDLEDWFKAEAELLHPLKINMTETEKSLVVQAEVPGFSATELQIRMEPQRLIVSGHRQTNEEQKKGTTIYREHSSDQILRVIDLPAAVKTNEVNAMLKDGVLQLEMPKAAGGAKGKAVRIAVKAA